MCKHGTVEGVWCNGEKCLMKCVVVELGAATYTFSTLRYVYKQQQQQQQLYSLYKNTKVHHKICTFQSSGK